MVGKSDIYYLQLFCFHFLGHSDLTTRFNSTCINAVDWAVYGMEPYTAEHAQHFKDGVSMPTGINYSSGIRTALVDVRFTRFLLHFFHKALLPAVRKVRTSCMS